MLPISQLTSPQVAQLQTYHDRWRHLTCSTTAIDRQLAAKTVCHSYALMGKSRPDILFFAGPLDAQEYLQEQNLGQLLAGLGVPIWPLPFTLQLSQLIRSQLAPNLLADIRQHIQTAALTDLVLNLHLNLYATALSLDSTWMPMTELLARLPLELEPDMGGDLSVRLMEQLWQQQQTDWRQVLQEQPGGQGLIQLADTLWQWGAPVGQAIDEVCLQPWRRQPDIQVWEQGMQQMLATVGLVGLGWQVLAHAQDVFHPCLLDYCIEVLGCEHDPETWQLLRSLSTQCGFLLTFDKTCLVFDRPVNCHIDPEWRFHAEGEAALQFADGYCSYQFQGVQIPARYGKVHPHVWQAQWLLHEQNAELRRVLIQGIGYDRLCQELQAEPLDSWREYTLLRIAPTIDIEPIYLLKMICPSTGYIHATRVPPSTQSAREAIRWVNWDMDPEEFAQES